MTNSGNPRKNTDADHPSNKPQDKTATDQYAQNSPAKDSKVPSKPKPKADSSS